jgi:hypothetical protein
MQALGLRIWDICEKHGSMSPFGPLGPNMDVIEHPPNFNDLWKVFSQRQTISSHSTLFSSVNIFQHGSVLEIDYDLIFLFII